MLKFKFRALILGILLLQSVSLYAQQPLAGDWEGIINTPTYNLPITTQFTQDDSLNGNIKIQGTTLPLQNIRFGEPDSVFFEFVTSVNVAQFQGQFITDTTIKGQYHQAGQQFPFTLSKKEDPSNKSSKNYHTKDLTIQNDSVTIGGTLTWPKKAKAKHLVIMISGSGPQDRDETMTPVSNFKPFAVLADSLTMDNIATFRYDDRGIGESTGNFGNATLDMLAADVEAIIHDLTAMQEHDFEHIILLGHSQGGLVAGKLAAENPAIDKIILMASTGVPLKDVLRFQIKQAFAGSGIDSVLIEQEIAAREQLMQAIRDQQGIQQAKETYQKQFTDIQLAAGADSAQASSLGKRQTDQLMATFGSPQMQSLLFYDPTDDLRRLDIPVLVLFGGKDTQVTVDMNKEPIKTALDSADVPYQIWEFEQGNHLFQKAKTGSTQEYGSLEEQFVYPFTSTISNWIKKEQTQDE